MFLELLNTLLFLVSYSTLEANEREVGLALLGEGPLLREAWGPLLAYRIQSNSSAFKSDLFYYLFT